MMETRSRSLERKALEGKELSASEGGVILKRKKEVLEARARFKVVTRAAWEHPKPSGAVKKKVIRRLLPQKFIDSLKNEGLYTILPTEYTEKELAKFSQEFRNFYKAKKEIQDAERAYELAILEEYETNGYTIDETEVDDDEDEDTVKN